MSSSGTRSYGDSLVLVVFDWAGTIIDHGCCAPASAFIEGFKQRGVHISMAQAREPMGLEKREHIEAIARLEPVAQAWRRIHGRPLSDQDIEAMYQAFVPLLYDALEGNSTLIDGVIDTVASLRRLGLKIGTSTGYFREAAKIVTESAARQGFSPDYGISTSEVTAGRPYPWMIYRIMEKLQCCPPRAVVNVGDTVIDVQTGLNGAFWSVGVARTGNLCGLSLAAFARLPEDEARTLVAEARRKLFAAGAHYVVDSVAELPEVLAEINGRVSRGERP